MKLNTRIPSRKGFTLVELLVVMAIIAVLASIATPLVLNKTRDADKTKAIAHAKQCQIAFIEFEQAFGKRPGDETVSLIDGAAAASSNDCFRQLLQGIPSVRSEAIFFAPSKVSTEPDNDIGTVDDNFAAACEEGEVAFLYLDNPLARSGAPIMGAPLVSNSGQEFDFDKYNGKAVVLFSDGSVRGLNIDENTEQAMITISKQDVDVLSTQNKAFRANEAPNIKLPL